MRWPPLEYYDGVTVTITPAIIIQFDTTITETNDVCDSVCVTDYGELLEDTQSDQPTS